VSLKSVAKGSPGSPESCRSCPKKEQAKLSLTLHLWMGLAIVVVAIYTPPLLCVIPGMDSLVSSHGSFGKLGMADAQRLSLTFPSLSCPSAQSILHDF